MINYIDVVSPIQLSC